MAYRRIGGSLWRVGGRRADPAVRRARAVVGLYGDPGVSWSILLEARPVTPVDPDLVARRLHALAGRHPALGRPPVVQTTTGSQLAARRSEFADTPYGDHAPLVRAAVTSSGDTLLLAAHHGAVDGLGLVAVLNAALDTRLAGSARGVAGTPARRSFVAAATGRLGEVALEPPARFRPDGAARDEAGPPGDHLLARDVTAGRLSTGALLLATRWAFDRWNGTVPTGPVVVAVGASRRTPGEPPQPDRATAYLRVRVPRAGTLAETVRLLRSSAPEPDFPVTRGLGAAALVTRALASRLSATALVSNLGRLAGDGVEHATLWPAASGPAGIAIGLVTAGDSPSLSLRARGAAFGAEAARTLLQYVEEGLEDAARRR